MSPSNRQDKLGFGLDAQNLATEVKLRAARKLTIGLVGCFAELSAQLDALRFTEEVFYGLHLGPLGLPGRPFQLRRTYLRLHIGPIFIRAVTGKVGEVADLAAQRDNLTVKLRQLILSSVEAPGIDLASSCDQRRINSESRANNSLSLSHAARTASLRRTTVAQGQRSPCSHRTPWPFAPAW